MRIPSARPSGVAPIPLATALAVLAVLAVGCGGQPDRPRVLAEFPVDSLEGVKQAADPEVTFDPEISVDGNGSIHVDAAEARVVRLFEVDDLDLEGPLLLTWKAKLRSRSLFGRAFLEIWVRIPGKGEFFGRGLETSVRRSTDWTEAQAYFRVDEKVPIDRVRLNLVLEGGGHVWLDDAVLTAGPLD